MNKFSLHQARRQESFLQQQKGHLKNASKQNSHQFKEKKKFIPPLMELFLSDGSFDEVNPINILTSFSNSSM